MVHEAAPPSERAGSATLTQSPASPSSFPTSPPSPRYETTRLSGNLRVFGDSAPEVGGLSACVIPKWERRVEGERTAEGRPRGSCAGAPGRKPRTSPSRGSGLLPASWRLFRPASVAPPGTAAGSASPLRTVTPNAPRLPPAGGHSRRPPRSGQADGQLPCEQLLLGRGGGRQRTPSFQGSSAVMRRRCQVDGGASPASLRAAVYAAPSCLHPR